MTGETGGSTRRLALFRHAKSAWPNVPDIDRPLAERGQRDAPAAGRWLRDVDFRPDLVLCSPAKRTRQTWELAAAQLVEAPPVRHDDRIYDTDADGLLSVLTECQPEIGTLLVVGHEPTMRDLTLRLAAGDPTDALARVRAKFPTAAVSVLEFAGDWAELADDAAQLTAFAVLRG